MITKEEVQQAQTKKNERIRVKKNEQVFWSFISCGAVGMVIYGTYLLSPPAALIVGGLAILSIAHAQMTG